MRAAAGPPRRGVVARPLAICTPRLAGGRLLRGTRVIGRARSGSFWDGLVNLGLPMLPAGSPIASVSVGYSGAEHRLLGWKTHWLIVFISWSVVGAMVPKFLFGIEV